MRPKSRTMACIPVPGLFYCLFSDVLYIYIFTSFQFPVGSNAAESSYVPLPSTPPLPPPPVLMLLLKTMLLTKMCAGSAAGMADEPR